ncbi:RING-H2 finger protein ATL8-like [Diospyros lotus]|uniref:RING-H2 finger protein ATL8-like n=1 Tax=Diospyros lotus TaxID=55363 RepID=UPI00225AFA9C|nr:RING-H2 finger protein ATL8-like [Diospyros lotus]
MLGSGMNLITTIIGFGMSVTFILFVCTRLICGRLRRADESRRMFEIDLEQPQHQNTGLEPAVVAAIPTVKFNREVCSSLEAAQCTICLGEYQEKEVLRIMPKCGHNFHLSCIDVWLKKHSTCPVCRLPLQGSFEAKRVRPAALSGIYSSVESPEILTEHSPQWLLPSAEHSEGSSGQQGHIASISGNREFSPEEAETRQRQRQSYVCS